MAINRVAAISFSLLLLTSNTLFPSSPLNRNLSPASYRSQLIAPNAMPPVSSPLAGIPEHQP